MEGPRIATVHGIESLDADLKLISAAPDLLEALRDIIREADGGWFKESPLARAARGAIKKATQG